MDHGRGRGDRKHKTSFISEDIYKAFDRELRENIVAEGLENLVRLFLWGWERTLGNKQIATAFNNKNHRKNKTWYDKTRHGTT